MTSCADTVEVAQAFQAEQLIARQQARVPSAGLVWWRSQLRSPQEAARAAARPINFAQAFAGACGIGLAIGLVARMTDSFFLVAVLGALVILAPLALYVVFSDQ